MASAVLAMPSAMRVEHDGAYAAVASMGGAPTNPQWYHALTAEPVIELQDGTSSGLYRARELSGAEKQEWWDRSAAVFPQYDAYQQGTDRPIPVLLLEPEPAD